MEMHFNSSIEMNDPVAVTLLTKIGENYGARFVAWSEDGINVNSETAIEIGSVVRLETTPDLMVAEVRDCQPRDGEFSVALRLLERIQKSDLQRLMREMGGEAVPVSIAAELSA